MGISRLGPLLACLQTAFVAAAGSALASPRQAPELLLPVTTEVVRIDVVVTDKGGRPRQGLTAQDFVVLEDGQPQKIAQFEAFLSTARTPVPATAASPPPAGLDGDDAGDSPSRVVPPRRYVVLLVDDRHIEAKNLIRIKKALDRFLDREVGPEDQIALVTTGGTRGLYQEFTDDRHVLRRSVERLSVQDRTGTQSGIPFITEYQAEQIERGDPDALRVAVEEVMLNLLFQDPASAEPVARATARTVLTESVHNARVTLETLDGVVRGLSDLQGRKVVALISDGFLPGLTIGGQGAFDIRRITDAGTRAGVVVYALDTRGLVANGPGPSASSRMPMQAVTFGARDILLRESEHATRDAMGSLAGDTGGFLVHGTNNLGSGLRKILKDTETYYLIAYESTNPRRDGAFRKLEVRIPGQRDARIRTRKGYFAPDDQKARPGAPAASVAQSAKPPEGPRESDLRRALTSLAPLRELGVRLSADFVSVDGAEPQVVVSSHIDLNGVPFVRVADRQVATVDVAAMVFDESGEVVGSLAPERVAMDLSDSSYAESLQNGLLFQKATALRPGRYRVRVAVREDGEGKLGSASQWVQVPDLKEGKLTLSSLFLLEKEDPAQEAGPAAGVSLRGAQALRRFKRDENLYVQNFAYNPARDASGATNLVTQAEIWRAGVLLASSAPESMAQADGGGTPLLHTRSIKLQPFAPGEYEVRVVVTDQNANQMTSRRVGITIE
jgi:VWFA-related protein